MNEKVPNVVTKQKKLDELGESLSNPLSPGVKKFPTSNPRLLGKSRAQLKKEGLTDKQIENILKEAQIPKDTKGTPHQGVKTDQEGNPILAIAKGGMVRKKKTAKKSKKAGRAAKRGYGMAKRGK